MVTLIGAGPGDKGLLTLKGAEALQKADVVLYDRFVGREILEMVPAAAEKIDVGKCAGTHPVPQQEINTLLLEKAKKKLNVVRLKGGDPFLFGRGGEELELLYENGIPFQVVPGVTSAIAGAAYAGIPVTHRDYASSLHIITAHGKNNSPANINYKALTELKGTIVFLMGVSAVEEICKRLILAEMRRDTPAAIVENATESAQRKLLATVETLPKLAKEAQIKSPSLIVVGDVCSLSEKLDWFGRKPLLGRRTLVATAQGGASRLSDKLKELGCDVYRLPGAEIIRLTAPGCPLDKALKRIEDYSWLVFTSAIGVNIFFDYLPETDFDIRGLSRLKVACVGAETEKEINKRGIKCFFRPSEYNGEALAKGLVSLAEKDERLLIPRAKDGAKELTDILKNAKIPFEDIAIYEKKGFKEKLSEVQADFAAFTSSSCVERFAETAEWDYSKIKAVCIGERTASAARKYGMDVYVSDEATVDSIVNKIQELSVDGG